MAHENPAAVANAYYQAMGRKDLSGVARCLHPEIQFKAPLATLSGKEAVVEAAGRLFGLFQTLTTRAVLGSDSQAMVAYDLHCPAPIGVCRAAALMHFKEGLIFQLELFFDARPFDALQNISFVKPS